MIELQRRKSWRGDADGLDAELIAVRQRGIDEHVEGGGGKGAKDEELEAIAPAPLEEHARMIDAALREASLRELRFIEIERHVMREHRLRGRTFEAYTYARAG